MASFYFGIYSCRLGAACQPLERFPQAWIADDVGGFAKVFRRDGRQGQAATCRTLCGRGGLHLERIFAKFANFESLQLPLRRC